MHASCSRDRRNGCRPGGWAVRRRWVIVAATVAVLALGGLLWMVTLTHGHHPRPVAATPTGAPTVGQGPQVAAALHRLTTDPGSLVATEAAGFVGGRAPMAVPSGATVTPDVSSWSPDGAGGGTMLVTIATGGRTVTYAAVMVQETGAWKVLATFVVAG